MAESDCLRLPRPCSASGSFSSIGIAEICAAAGVQKGSFFSASRSKQALALAVIEEHWIWQGTEWAKIFDAVAPLLGAPPATSSAPHRRHPGSPRCGRRFGNGLPLRQPRAGDGRKDDPIRERLQGIFDEQIDMVERSASKRRWRTARCLPGMRKRRRSRSSPSLRVWSCLRSSSTMTPPAGSALGEQHEPPAPGRAGHSKPGLAG